MARGRGLGNKYIRRKGRAEMTLGCVKHEAFWIATADTAGRAAASGDCPALCSSCTILGPRNLKAPLPAMVFSLLVNTPVFRLSLSPSPTFPVIVAQLLAVLPLRLMKFGETRLAVTSFIQGGFLHPVPSPPQAHYIGTVPASPGLSCPCQHVVSIRV